MIYFIGCCVCIYIFVRYILPIIIALVIGAFERIGAFKARIGNKAFWEIVAGIIAIPALIGYIGLFIYHKNLFLIIGWSIVIWAIIYNAKEKYFERKQNKTLDKKIMRWTLKKRT